MIFIFCYFTKVEAMTTSNIRPSKGFALVATISILSLVVMIALAMMSLATTSNTISISDKHIEEARANARLALSEAIQKLQQHAGSDKRITASSDIASMKQRHLTGVWLSHGEPILNTSGNQTSIDASNIAQTYDQPGVTGRQQRWISWLVSGAEGKGFEYANSSFADSLGSPLNNAKHVTLVGKGSLGTKMNTGGVDEMIGNYVHAEILNLNKNGQSVGGYAYWVDDLGVKARVNLNTAKNNNVSPFVVAVSAASTAINKLDGLEAIDKNSDLEKAITYDSVGLVNTSTGTPLDSTVHANLFFDLNCHSEGLHTSVYGGLKKDLNLAFERTSSGGSPTLPSDFSSRLIDEGPTWTSLRDYYISYRSPAEGGLISWESDTPFIDLGDTHAKTKSLRNWHKFIPIISKQHQFISIGAEKNPEGTAHRIRLIVNPVFELWNPYSIALRPPRNSVISILQNVFPISIAYKTKDVDGDGELDLWKNRSIPMMYSMSSMQSSMGAQKKDDDVFGGNVGFHIQSYQIGFKDPSENTFQDFRPGASYLYWSQKSTNGTDYTPSGGITPMYRLQNDTGGVYTDALITHNNRALGNPVHLDIPIKNPSVPSSDEGSLILVTPRWAPARMTLTETFCHVKSVGLTMAETAKASCKEQSPFPQPMLVTRSIQAGAHDFRSVMAEFHSGKLAKSS